MQKSFLLLKKLKNTESAQLCTGTLAEFGFGLWRNERKKWEGTPYEYLGGGGGGGRGGGGLAESLVDNLAALSEARHLGRRRRPPPLQGVVAAGVRAAHEVAGRLPEAGHHLLLQGALKPGHIYIYI